MGLSDQEAAARRIEDHGTQHNARGRDRQGSLACPTRTARGLHDSTASLLSTHRTKRNQPGRTPYKRSTLHQSSQHTASPNATRCTSHRTALPSPSRNSTFCRASGKPNHDSPLLPASDRQASARLRPSGTHCSTAHSPTPTHRPRPQAFLCSPWQYRNPTK